VIPRPVLAAARIAFAALTLIAIAYQLAVTAESGRLDVVNFFSYFTILSNLLAAVVLLLGAAKSGQPPSRTWDLVRGQAVMVMTVTFVVFAVLLADTDVDVSASVVNFIVHTLFPIVVIVDWLVDPPGSSVSARDGLVWLVGPLVWTAYTLLRGALTGWYPYPFLDPAQDDGYVTVAAYVVGILIFGTIVCILVALAGTAMRDHRVVAAPDEESRNEPAAVGS
jgi:hypothetical protein